jgi:hydroxyethylthiazole kinase-like uncharacterized protein yjeF
MVRLNLQFPLKEKIPSLNFYLNTLTQHIVKSLIKPREASSHKGTYGHALLVAGNVGRMGAAVIAARACLRSGAGLLTVNLPENERVILQTAIPEAMLIFRNKTNHDLSVFSSLGIGCGIGTEQDSVDLLSHFLTNYNKPILLDADALNIISANNLLLRKVPHHSIITPHPKEFDRLFGVHHSIEKRIDTAIKKAKELNITIVLKGHKTLITNNGESFLNSTGNAGLAKGGSGDALSGIITALLAQGYNPFTAAKIGVFIHGLAADITLKTQSMESMLITDVIESLGDAFKEIMCE